MIEGRTRMAMGAPLLRFEGFTLELATASGWVRVLDGIDLAVGEGEALALVGESGSGKTLAPSR